MKNFAQILASLFLVAIATSCKDDAVPKPSASLRLDYPVADYFLFSKDCPYQFLVNADAVVKKLPNCNLEVVYPKMKATVYVNYRDVSGDVKLLLRDAQKLTYNHVIKADNITEQPFVNAKFRVFGMFYEVDGNAATNGQFYVTDSLKHFVDCSVYFYAKPNFDSIMPAADYIKNDMRRMMESMQWKQ